MKHCATYTGIPNISKNPATPLENTWNGVRQIIVYEGLKAKFSQNTELKEKLVDTGDVILAECAVRDQIWGIGLSMRDPNRLDQSKWKGKNLLGYALMMVREQL